MAIALECLGLPPARLIANLCLDDITQLEFKACLCQLIEQTNYFQTLVDKQVWSYILYNFIPQIVTIQIVQIVTFFAFFVLLL